MFRTIATWKRGALLSLLGLAALAGPLPSAGATYDTTALVSAGRNYPYDPCDYPYSISLNCGKAMISRDAAHIVFGSPEPLIPADTDESADVYDRTGGQAILVSTGPSGGSGGFDASPNAVSADGSRIFFTTSEPLVAADTDDRADIYERSGGTTTLVSTGPADPGASIWDATFKAASDDGTRVFFETRESLVAGESDCHSTDVYERSGGTTTLVSGNAAGACTCGCTDASYRGATPDGSHVYFETAESLDPADIDSSADVYERSGGTTSLISVATIGGTGPYAAHFDAVTPDGSKVFFSTIERMDPASDLDGVNDLYQRSGGTTTLISTGPADTSSESPACTTWSGVELGGPCPVRVSDDGAHVFFFTHAPLVAGDTGYLDVYERTGGTTNLVSTGPSGGNGPFHVKNFLLISTDGLHAFFSTIETLAPPDGDGRVDIYERTGATTALVSTGPTEANEFVDAIGNAVSEDGTRAIFSTTAKLIASDTDTLNDVYQREGGTTTVLSTGPNDDGLAFGNFVTASPDVAHVVFHTQDALTSADGDFCPRTGHACDDLYDRFMSGSGPSSSSATGQALSLVSTAAKPTSATASPAPAPASAPAKVTYRKRSRCRAHASNKRAHAGRRCRARRGRRSSRAIRRAVVVRHELGQR